MKWMRQLCCLLPLLAITLIGGCGTDSKSIVLSDDELERRERKAIDALRAEGCKLEETEDEIIKARGILVRLFPEHLTETGTIRSELIRELRDLRKCFLILDNTPIKPAGFEQLKTINNILLLSAQRAPITDESLRQIEGIVSLRLLRLNGTKVGDEGLRHINRLPELRMLYLNGTKISDRGAEQLAALKKLQALQLAETALTDVGATVLTELPELEFLSLRETDITDETVAVLTKLKRLKHVDLTDTRVSSDGMQKLKDALPDCFVKRELTFRARAPVSPSSDSPNP